MATVSGIDEAGFGPVLGPLVVSASTFEVPEECMEANFWGLLAGCICRRPPRRSSKVAIDDSKKLYAGLKSETLVNLERGVLAMLASRSQPVASLRELISQVAPKASEAMTGYPWYAEDLPLPRCVTPMNIRLAGNSLRTSMSRFGMRLQDITCEPVFAGEFNRHVTSTDNKSAMLFDITSRHLWRIWNNSPPGKLRIYVDRQGGRTYYLPALQRLFPNCSMKILEENRYLSAYRITGDDREAEICFFVDCDARSLPVALASMASKYLRELYMELLNGFWVGRMPGLKPSAGYYGDGRRFYRDIAALVREAGYDETMILRAR
jgi:ribonuclease HII